MMLENVEAGASLGAWIRRRRKALDLTQVALANLICCAEVTIRKWEADTARPSHEMAERLATWLEISPAEHRLFLQVARGERRADRLPPPLYPIDSVSPSIAQAPIPIKPLSIDTIPAPGPLPSGSRMPLRRNPLFVGRTQDLLLLAQELMSGGTAAIGQMEIAAATGLGGIGKTQLACEFVHRYGQSFPGGVFWLSFADPAAIPAEVAACGGLNGMLLCTDFDRLPLDEQVRRVVRAWQDPIPRLLVFDNCEEETLLDQWHPKHGGCRVLLTSRRHHWDPALGVQAVPLDVLPRQESIALLRTFRPDIAADDPDLAAIVDTLGHLPLALHLAGSFLANYRHILTPAQYRERLRVSTILDDRSLQVAGLSPTQHVQHVARTFEQSCQRLDPRQPIDALALMLLTRAACCAPGESIPRWFLLRTLSQAEHVDTVLFVEDAFNRLIDLGLLDTDVAGNLRLHRLVAAFVQTIAMDAAAQTDVETTMLAVATSLNQARDPRPGLALEAHLRFITDAAAQYGTAQTAGLCNALGMHLHLLGAYAEAQHYVERALDIRERVLGADHPDTAQSLLNLGVMLVEQGQYADSRYALERALNIRERVLGADHPDTASCLLNLGVVLIQQGQYAEARRYLERSLAIRERVLGADHLETVRTLHNLGVVLRLQGEYTDARRYAERVLAIRERVLGADHPERAWCLFNLGLVLIEQGQYAEAQHYVECALAIRERVLGTDHPDTAWCLQFLGDVLRLRGQHAEAQHAAERSLAIRERVLGADHPDTAQSLQNVGVVLIQQGQYAEARRYLERSLAIRERVLGADHLETVRSLHDLGVVLIEQGQYAEARHYLERALEIRARMLGADHPDTARCQMSLGRVLREQGIDAGAQGYVERAAAILEQRLGAHHPEVQAARRMHIALVLPDTVERGA